MVKKDIVIQMSKDAGISGLQAEKALRTVTESIKRALKKGERVTLSGFGSFEVKAQKARKGRNPKTGEEIQIPKKFRIKFNPSQSLKNSLKD
ncbi:MAG: HU family DNA-binding protein [Candidatus Aminicenantes bacterium]